MELRFENSVKQRLSSLPVGTFGTLYTVGLASDSSWIVALVVEKSPKSELKSNPNIILPTGLVPVKQFKVVAQRESTPEEDEDCFQYVSGQTLEVIKPENRTADLCLVHCQITAKDLISQQEWYSERLQRLETVSLVGPNGSVVQEGSESVLRDFFKPLNGTNSTKSGHNSR